MINILLGMLIMYCIEAWALSLLDGKGGLRMEHGWVTNIFCLPMLIIMVPIAFIYKTFKGDK